MIVGIEEPSLSPYLEKVLKSQSGARSSELESVDVLLKWQANALDLSWFNGDKKPLSLNIDYLPQAQRLRSFPAPKQDGFNQALGKRTKRVLDLSGGFGADSLLMSLQGYQVTVVERLPLMAALIEDAFERLSQQSWLGRDNWHCPIVINRDAADFIVESSSELFDCVYFDPMFPDKKKRSAASNKYMQFLQAFAGSDQDSALVAQQVMDYGFNRLVVKRPAYARPLIEPMSTQFSSKLVHFDVYFG